MKLICVFLMWLWPLCLQAGDFQGEIYEIDVKAATLTLSSKKGVKIYRVRPGLVVTINGVEGKFEDLALGMQVKAISADPTVATELIAVGVPSRPAADSPAQAAAGKTLGERLSNTRWRLEDGKEFTLQPDGKTNSSWHKRQGSWRVIAGNSIELKIMHKSGPLEKASVNADATCIRWIDGGLIAYQIKSSAD